MRAWYFCKLTKSNTPIIHALLEHKDGTLLGLDEKDGIFIRICDFGHLPYRQPPIMKDPFTYTDHSGNVIFTITDPDLIVKITAAILCKTT